MFGTWVQFVAYVETGVTMALHYLGIPLQIGFATFIGLLIARIFFNIIIYPYIGGVLKGDFSADPVDDRGARIYYHDARPRLGAGSRIIEGEKGTKLLGSGSGSSSSGRRGGGGGIGPIRANLNDL